MFDPATVVKARCEQASNKSGERVPRERGRVGLLNALSGEVRSDDQIEQRAVHKLCHDTRMHATVARYAEQQYDVGLA